jgi:hypothetical protein
MIKFMVPTVNSFTLSQTTPAAQLVIYPDSGHSSLFSFRTLCNPRTDLPGRTRCGHAPLDPR